MSAERTRPTPTVIAVPDALGKLQPRTTTLPPNDPGPNSLFVKASETECECTICGARMFNSTEARDSHLNRKGCHVAEPSCDLQDPFGSQRAER